MVKSLLAIQTHTLELKGKIMYSIWFLGLNDEPIEIKVHTIESAQKIWEDLEISGWHMISTYP